MQVRQRSEQAEAPDAVAEDQERVAGTHVTVDAALRGQEVRQRHVGGIRPRRLAGPPPPVRNLAGPGLLDREGRAVRFDKRPDLRIMRNRIQNAVQDEDLHAEAGKQVEPPGGPEAPERGIPGNQQDRPADAAVPDAQEESGLDLGLRRPGRRQAGRAQGGQKSRIVTEPAGAYGLAVREQAPDEGPERVAPRAGGRLAAISPGPVRMACAPTRTRASIMRSTGIAPASSGGGFGGAMPRSASAFSSCE